MKVSKSKSAKCANAGSIPPCKALLVDDSPSVLTLLSASLKRSSLESMEIDCAITIEDALEKCAAEDFDLLIFDSVIPPYESYRDSLPLFKDAYDGPVVLLTGWVPDNFGAHPIDHDIAAVFAKDEMLNSCFVDRLKDTIVVKQSGDSFAWL